MSDRIEFLLWAPDRDTFVSTMCALKLPNGRPVARLVDGELVPSDGLWIDEIGEIATNLPTVETVGGVLQVVAPGSAVPGHHVNMAAYGWLAGALTAGRPAVGTIFERTCILALLGEMDWTESVVGEPAGFVGTSGVKLFDPAVVARRASVWA